jgi:photosystem II stability/assembly factor-like uncharacterized protein
VTIAPTGTIHAIAFSYNYDPATTAINVSRSTDGGQTWSKATTLVIDTQIGVFNDRPAITADPIHPGVVYASWDRASGNGSKSPFEFAKSVDDGLTWSTPQPFPNPSAGNASIGNIISVLPDGTLVDAYELDTKNQSWSYQVMRSTDQGQTWSEPITVADVGAAASTLTTTAPNGANMRNATLPLLAVDRSSGVISAVFQSSTVSNGSTVNVAFTQSTDGGRTWSQPIRIDHTPNGPSLVPSIATVNGTLAVTYYDFRKAGSNPSTLPTDFWLVTCRANCTSASSWAESHVDGSFDALLAPNTSHGYMLGDYSGLVASSGGLVSLYAKTVSSSDPTNLYSAFVNP